ncbi:hypothetical protein NJ76_23550 [Rhodococcus sp. IITR03]|nr:hypothetical protein NJ76_23550 [Rhodococcus sp. IITR03]
MVALRVMSGRATTAVTDQDPDDDPVSISCVMTATRTSARKVAAEPFDYLFSSVCGYVRSDERRLPSAALCFIASAG